MFHLFVLNVCLEIILCEENKIQYYYWWKSYCRRSLLYDVYRFTGTIWYRFTENDAEPLWAPAGGNNWIRLVTDNGGSGRSNAIKKIYKFEILATAGDKRILMKMDLVQKRLIAVIVATAVILRSFNFNSFVCTSWKLVPRHTFCCQLNYSKFTENKSSCLKFWKK